MNEKYEKIIDLPHHTSELRPKMSKHDRAAQFAPYSALSGYEDAVDETSRLTDREIELDEYEKERINSVLSVLLASPPETEAAITYFEPDKIKSGGAYITLTGNVGKYDDQSREITLLSGKKINIDRIIDVHFSL